MSVHADDRASVPRVIKAGSPALGFGSVALPLLLSGLVHFTGLQVVVWMGGFGTHPDEPPPTEFELAVALPPPEVPEPVVEAEPEAEEPPEVVPPPPQRPPPARPAEPDVPPPPPDEPPPPVQETPVAFDNLVLSNEGDGASWSTAQGSGEETDGPIGGPGAVSGRSRQGYASGTPDGTGDPSPGPRVVGVADLSRAPTPNGDFGAQLQRFYPAEARAQGREGTVTARIRILPNGRVRVLRLQRATSPEFGSACRRFLQRAARFSPPLDQQGAPVATDASIECEFSVRY